MDEQKYPDGFGGWVTDPIVARQMAALDRAYQENLVNNPPPPREYRPVTDVELEELRELAAINDDVDCVELAEQALAGDPMAIFHCEGLIPELQAIGRMLER